MELISDFIPAIFVALAAISKAVADTLVHHYHTSIFRNWDQSFWNPEQSWKRPLLKPTKYRLDGWHLANSLMIVFFSLAIVFHKPVLAWYWEVLIAGTLFNLWFNLFYNKILR